jgi:prolyl oligopeptidase
MTQQRHRYPTARKADVVDDYHGTRVADPYRWLEEPDNPETVAWVEAQNELTRSVLEGPTRDALVQRLAGLFDFPRTSVPFKRGNRYFYTRNAGLQKQPVLFVQDGLHGEPRVLLDPNKLDPDGTIALTAVAVDDNGTLMAYGLSRSGSDIQEISIRDVASGVDLADRIQWVKFASIAWVPDSSGFYYTRFPEPGSVPPGDENYFSRVHYHKLGDPQERDALIFDAPGQRETVFTVDVSDNGRWVVITAFKGSSDKSEVFLLDRGSRVSTPQPLFTGFHSAYAFIQEAGGRLFFHTDNRAPLGRIIAVDPGNPGEPPVEVVPESSDKLSTALIVNHTLVTSYLRNASDRIRLFNLSGAPAGEIPLPGIGSLTGITGRPADTELFTGFTSFTHAPANYRYEFASKRLEPFGDSASPVDASRYETSQVWYPSKDGTRVSMFLVHRKDLPRDGQRPVLLSGYGGFNINLTPAFDPSIFAWLDRGGIQAVANLRGGGEYGEAWHQAGMFERKQNVFDDFMAAAEWLAASGYTSPRKIGIEGGSNGGLLTGAVMVQRPELFGAVVCRVPVADMLRYHLFTVGRFWISEYGSSDDRAQFEYLYKYSPLHNVRDGAAYPPILITTADTDDRVSPGMAKKFAARLQEAAPDDATVLIRVETRAGHGAGKPVSKVIDEDADIFAFLIRHLGA